MVRYFTRVYGGIAPGYTQRVLDKNKNADGTNPTIFAIVAKAASHPTTSTMVNSAIRILNQRNGSSHRAIKNWIRKRYKIYMNKLLSLDINKYLITAVESGVLIQVKGEGARGNFKLPLPSISKPKTTRAAKVTTATLKTKPAPPKKGKCIEMKSSLGKVIPPKRTTTATSTTETPVSSSTRSKKSSDEVKPTKSSVETKTKVFKKTASAKRATETPTSVRLTRSKTSSSFKPIKSVETKTNFKKTTQTSVRIERRRSPRIINAIKVSTNKEMKSSSKKVTRPERVTRNTPVKRAPFRQR